MFKCIFPECNKDFYDKGNLKYHETKNHSEELKYLPFNCEHFPCNMKFKTAQEKLLHHHQMMPNCQQEKKLIVESIVLLRGYMDKFELNGIDISKYSSELLRVSESNRGSFVDSILEDSLFKSIHIN